MRSKLPLVLTVLLFCFVTEASAHYLWSTIDSKSGKHGAAKIYSEESPAAGDGRYLKHFEKSKKT